MYKGLIGQHLDKVLAFVTVARLGSITKASKALAISQAALSQSMKTLESALDLTLLQRSKAGVSTTDEGEVLLAFGERLLEDLSLLETKLRVPGKQDFKRIRIGTHEALATHYWPEAVESFQADNPDFYLSIVSGRVDALVDQLMQHSIDIVVSVKPRPAKGLFTKTLYKENLRFYGPSGKIPIAGRQLNTTKLDKAFLAQLPILTDCHAHLAQDHSVLKILIENGLHGAQYFQLNSFQAAQKLAAKGMGVALLPSRFGDATPELQRITIKGLDEKIFHHAVCFSCSESEESKEHISLLLRHLRKHN